MRGRIYGQSGRYAHAVVGAQRTALPGEDNFGWIDRYTAGHAAFGILGGLARLPWWGMLASGLFWDLVIRAPVQGRVAGDLSQSPPRDTWKNITGDTIAMMLGWKVANLLPEGKKPMHTTLPKELP